MKFCLHECLLHSGSLIIQRPEVDLDVAPGPRLGAADHLSLALLAAAALLLLFTRFVLLLLFVLAFLVVITVDLGPILILLGGNSTEISA